MYHNIMNKLKLIIAFFSIIIFACIVYVNNLYKNKLISIELQASLKELKTNYDIVIYHYKQNANTIFSRINNNQEIKELLSQAKGAKTKEEKDKIRKQLLKLLSRDFNEVKNLGVNIMLISFPDNKAFLRLHKPEKYGDDLSSLRSAIVDVNKKKKRISVFESGKLTHSFRNIYPIF